MSKYLYSFALLGVLVLGGCGSDSDDTDSSVKLNRIASLDLNQTGDNQTEVTAEDMALSPDGKTVYLADGSAGLKVIDVADAKAPKLIAHVDDASDAGANRGGFARRITISPDGNTIYMADGLAGLKVIDVTTPSNSQQIGKLDTAGFSHGITVSADGKVVIISDNGEDGGTPGVRVVDVSSPSNPIMITEKEEQWAAQTALSPDGKKLFVANRSTGVEMVDVSDVHNPKQLAKVETAGSAEDVILSKDGTKLYVANGKAGFAVLSIEK